MNKYLKYNQAKQYVLNFIAKKQLEKGAPLPSLSEFMKEASFSLICLRRALDELEADGIIMKHQGRRAVLNKPIRGSYNTNVLFLQLCRTTMEEPKYVYQIRELLSSYGIGLDFLALKTPEIKLLNAASKVQLIVISGWITEEWVVFLKSLKLPIFVFGNNPFPEEFPEVSCDWAAGTRYLCRALLKNGCRKIGLINGAKEYYPTKLIQEVFQDETRTDFDIRRVFYFAGAYGEDDAKHMAEYLRSNTDCDGFLIETGAIPQYLLLSREFEFTHRLPIALLGNERWSTSYPYKTLLAANFETNLTQILLEQLLSYLEKGSIEKKTIRALPTYEGAFR